MRYGLAKKFKRGIRLKIYPAFKCSLACDYCGNDLQIGLDPQNTKRNLSADEWFDLISNFPITTKEIVLTGGEPSIWRGFSELVNKLLDNGYFVMILTNLTTVKPFLDIRSNSRFLIFSTFHSRWYSTEKFVKN